MKAILLCAGFGTRLMPLTRDRAKPLLPVADAPIIEHLLRALDASGKVDRATIVSNRRFFDAFVRWRDGTAFERLSVEVLDNGVTREEERRGAVGDLLWAKRTDDLDEDVLVAAGDNLFRISFEAFFADAANVGGSVVAVYHEPDVTRLRRTGVAEIASDGRIVRLTEKPVDPKTYWACPALYVLTCDALRSLDAYVAGRSQADDLGSFLSWLVERQPVFAHEMQGERWDVGDRASYDAAEAWWSR